MDRKTAESSLLLERWKTAREKRLLWEDSSYFEFDFDDEKYQRLFNEEIAAEALYLMSLPILIHGVELSWRDYCLRRKQARGDKEEL